MLDLQCISCIHVALKGHLATFIVDLMVLDTLATFMVDLQHIRQHSSWTYRVLGTFMVELQHIMHTGTIHGGLTLYCTLPTFMDFNVLSTLVTFMLDGHGFGTLATFMVDFKRIKHTGNIHSIRKCSQKHLLDGCSIYTPELHIT